LLRSRSLVRGLAIVVGSISMAVGQTKLAWVPKELPYRSNSLAVAADTGRGRLVMFADGATWEWDGITWTKRITATTPPARDFHAMAYDSARRRTVVFGGGLE
jgi:hypothetical protein